MCGTLHPATSQWVQCMDPNILLHLCTLVGSISVNEALHHDLHLLHTLSKMAVLVASTHTLDARQRQNNKEIDN